MKTEREKTLHLTLKKKWFNMIASGIKKEEYREIKPYWERRFHFGYSSGRHPYPSSIYSTMSIELDVHKVFDFVSANNGYSKGCPNVKWKHRGIRIGKPNPEWCESEDIDKTVFILEIGEIIAPN